MHVKNFQKHCFNIFNFLLEEFLMSTLLVMEFLTLFQPSNVFQYLYVDNWQQVTATASELTQVNNIVSFLMLC